MRKFIRVNLSRAPALRPISFFDYCEVSFDMGFEVTYSFDRKCEDKHFDIMGLGPEAVVFKRKWTALLSAEKCVPQRRVKIYRNPWAVHLNQYHPNVRLFIAYQMDILFWFPNQKKLYNIKKTEIGPRRW